MSDFHPKRTLDVRQTRSLGPVPLAFRDWFAAPLPKAQALGWAPATNSPLVPATGLERVLGRPAVSVLQLTSESLPEQIT